MPRILFLLPPGFAESKDLRLKLLIFLRTFNTGGIIKIFKLSLLTLLQDIHKLVTGLKKIIKTLFYKVCKNNLYRHILWFKYFYCCAWKQTKLYFIYLFTLQRKIRFLVRFFLIPIYPQKNFRAGFLHLQQKLRPG